MLYIEKASEESLPQYEVRELTLEQALAALESQPPSPGVRLGRDAWAPALKVVPGPDKGKSA